MVVSRVIRSAAQEAQPDKIVRIPLESKQFLTESATEFLALIMSEAVEISSKNVKDKRVSGTTLIQALEVRNGS